MDPEPSSARRAVMRDSRWRVGFTTLLVNSMAIGPLVVFGLTALSPIVVSSLGLSRGQFGAIAGTAFAVAMCSSVLSGYFVDRLAGRSVLLVLSVLAAMGIVTVSVGSSFASVMVAAGLSGIAIALGNPATNQLISAHLGSRGRGTLIGLKQAGVPFMQMILGLMLPLAALAWGWRAAIVTLLVLPVVNIVLAVTFVPRRAIPTTPRAGSPGVAPSRAVWWLAAYSLLMGMPLQATNAYLPLYAHQQLGLDLATAGLSMTVAGAVGLLARLAWGWASDQISAPERLLVVLALVSASGSTLLWAAGRSGLPAFFWAGVVLHGATAIAAIVVTIVVLVRSVDHATIGTASGVLATGQFAGFSAGPVMFGLLVDRTNSYAPAWLGSALVYLAACVVIGTWLQLRVKEQTVGLRPVATGSER